MSEAGGAAALNGFLYQILVNLHRISEIRLSATLDGINIQSACLILEPKGGGGDTQYIGSDIRIVEQYKTRSENGTWSLKEIIEEVLTDLFRAIDLCTNNCEYRFVTDGRLGRLGHFMGFLQVFKSRETPENPVSVLDDTKTFLFFNNEHLTYRSLFLRIINIINCHKEEIDEIALYRKLWHLLARFSIQEKRSADDFKKGIDEFLYKVVDKREEIQSKRNELCGILLGLAAQGNVVITPEEILKKACLTNTPLSDFDSLKINLRNVTDEIFETKGYTSAMDVRSAPEWPDDKPVLILAGESGQGKTWQLCKLADLMLNIGQAVSLISSTGNADNDLQNACDIVWHRGLSRDGSIQIERLAEWYNKLFKFRSDFWLTVLIDDIQKIEEAKNLLSKPLKRWGIRLVFTAPLATGRILAASNPDVFLIEVPDFTLSELCDCLERRGYVWDEIPEDVRSTLCTPILADIYCKIANPSAWSPHNEYELYETYWRRVTTNRTQLDHPVDREILLKLVGAFFKGECIYPWPLSFTNDAGLTADAILRLESIGWLRRCGRADIEILHDRLLSWAVAEWLIDQRRTGKIELSEETQNLFLQFYENEPLFREKTLSYVPMDYLWLASEPNNGVKGDVSILLKLFEEHKTHGGYPEGYYLELISTLGERILPALTERIQSSISQKDKSFIPRLITEAIIRIGKKFPVPVKSIGMTFISSEVTEIQEAGASILEEYPDAKAIDRLWEIHKVNHYFLENRDMHERFTRYHKSFNALRECLQIKPEWLIEKIKTVDPNSEPVSELVWLLLNLKDFNRAREFWDNTKEILFAKVPHNKCRSLVHCIGRFKDIKEVPRLCQWLECRDDLTDMAAFSVLCQIAWDKALDKAEKIDEHDSIFTRSWWMPQLIARAPEKARERLLNVAKKKKDSLNYLNGIYSDHENLIDSATLHFILDTLESILSEQIMQIQKNDVVWPHFPLGFLYKINRPDLLKVLESKANTKLDDHISQIAQSRLKRLTDRFDLIFIDAVNVLCKICGKGLTDLINRALESENKYARLAGVMFALRLPDKRTLVLLRQLIQHEESDNLRPHTQVYALNALAALGDDDAVIKGVLEWGQDLSCSIFSLYKPNKPLNLDGLKSVFKDIKKDDDNNVLNSLMLIGITRNRDFIPLVRQLLKDNPPESKIARFSSIALMAIGDTSDEFIRYLKELLKTKENQFIATDYLLKINTPEALHAVADQLNNFGGSEIDVLGIAMSLFRKPETREKAGLFVLMNYKSWNFLTSDGLYLEIIPELDCPNVHDILIEEAFKRVTQFPNRIIHAIKGLWKIDQPSALRASKLNLIRTSTIKDFIPSLLVQLSEEHAIEILCEHMPTEETTSTRWSIGRALRNVQNRDSLENRLNNLVSSNNSLERAAAVEIIGWQPCDFLHQKIKNLALNDIDETVRRKSIEALQQHEEQKWIKELMMEFQSASRPHRWSLLASITELGDPYILSEKNDVLWIGQILNNCSLEYEDFAEELIKKKKKDVLDKAKSIDFKKGN